MNTQNPAASTAASPHGPLLEPADYSEYLLHDKSEILFVLRGLLASTDRITVYFNEGRDFFLTAIIAVENDGITLDYGSTQEINDKAINAEKLFCITQHDKVRIQFLLRGLKEIDFQGRPAFRAALPESVLRLQRREYYRLTTPIINPLKCQIPVTLADGSASTVAVNIVDISGGGVAIIIPPPDVPFEADMRFPNCRIELPEVGTLVVTLQVRSVFDVTLRSGAHLRRAGCQFVKLPGPMLTLVQRYIIKVERERKARESGIA
jgi:c-di-GMP-binding flagellar brake protein YcgR